MFREGLQIGHYTLIRKLGKGGFGEVWLAERKSKFVTTKVAVKLPLDEQVDHEAIKQEATLWEQASGHPNILPIIDADEYDGQIVIVSEYAPDGSLEQWLRRNGKMPVEKAVEMTIKILDVLEFLHSRNIIHRDLKPANILLQGETPRLADFGISRALRTTASSQSSNVSGTFAYMPPEGFDGKRSVQTDVWAVGVNLYQFLTGTMPFPQKEPSNLIAAIIMREPEPLPADIPQSLETVIAKALAKQSENRYASAKEMREDLRKVLVNVSFPQFAPTEVLPKPILPKNIAASATFESEDAKSKADEETVADAEPANYLTATKPLYPPDSVATQVKEKESVITQMPTVKMEKASQILPIEARAIGDTLYRKKNNNLLFALVGAGALVALGLIGIIGYNLSKSDSTTANTNKSNTTAQKVEVRKNSIGMEFVYIPPGDFMMGSDEESDEKPIHKVTISNGFWMGKTEVTQEQWQAVMSNNSSHHQNCSQCPVESVSWNNAKEFIAKLNTKNDGFEYRLPSEAEWEYAARAGTTGDYAGNLDSMAWYNANSGDKMHPVGQKQPNAFGLYDMHGNFQEWCEDIYSYDYNGLPTDGSANPSGGGKIQICV